MNPKLKYSTNTQVVRAEIKDRPTNRLQQLPTLAHALRVKNVKKKKQTITLDRYTD